MDKRLIQTVVAVLLLCCYGEAAAQGHGGKNKDKKQQPEERIQVVDDESCGCELYFIDGIQTTQKDDKFGFKRDDGTVIVEPKYMFVDKFHGDYCIVYNDYEHCGMIDREGREVVPVEYGEVSYPNDGMIRVRRNGLWGYYNLDGQQVIDCQYRSATGFSEGLAAVLIDLDSTEAFYGFIDKKDHIVLPAIYEYAFPFQEGYAVVKRYDRYGMIDRGGREVLPCKYLEVTPMFQGQFFAIDAVIERAALFNNKFKRMTDYVYENVIAYREGFYLVEKEGKQGFLNRKGQEQFGWYDQVGGFFEGFSFVVRDGKWGIIDKKGSFILPMEYDNSGYRSMAYMFSEGLAMVEKDGRYGFCDTKGRIVIPIVYQSAHQCTEGLIPVQRDGYWGYIDRDGNDVIAFLFDEASYFEWGRAEVVYKNETYKINPEGRCMKNCKTFPKQKIWIKD